MKEESDGGNDPPTKRGKRDQKGRKVETMERKGEGRGGGKEGRRWEEEKGLTPDQKVAAGDESSAKSFPKDYKVREKSRGSKREKDY